MCRGCLRCVAWFSYWFDNLGFITEGNTYRCCAALSLPLCGNTNVASSCIILTFHLDFDPEIVAQFFASVHFHTDEKQSMTWMTNGKRMTAEWKEFMDLLQVPDDGLDTPVGVRPHANFESSNKDKLQP